MMTVLVGLAIVLLAAPVASADHDVSVPDFAACHVNVSNVQQHAWCHAAGFEAYAGTDLCPEYMICLEFDIVSCWVGVPETGADCRFGPP